LVLNSVIFLESKEPPVPGFAIFKKKGENGSSHEKN
jgi:hypothetical protein